MILACALWCKLLVAIGSMQLGPLRHWQTGHARHMGRHWRHHRLILPPAAGCRMQVLCILPCALTDLQICSSHLLPEFSKHNFPPPGLVHLRMRLHHRRSMQILPVVATSKFSFAGVLFMWTHVMQARGKHSVTSLLASATFLKYILFATSKLRN